MKMDNISYEEFLKFINRGKLPQNAEEALAIRKGCPVNYALGILQGKWTNYVLFEMCAHQSIRFGELKKALPEITNTMLTSTLRELEDNGLVNRKQFNEIPPHVEYSLTEMGKALMPIYYEMFVWGEKYANHGISDGEKRR